VWVWLFVCVVVGGVVVWWLGGWRWLGETSGHYRQVSMAQRKSKCDVMANRVMRNTITVVSIAVL